MNLYKLIDIIGWLGTTLILGGFAATNFGYITAPSVEHSIINLFGGLCLLLKVLKDKNWSNVVLEIFFIFIALYYLLQ